MCLYPKLILNPKYKPNKKNGWNPPPVLNEAVRYVPIGCQRCLECRKQKARSWNVRLQEDLKEHKNGKFITLTFSDQSIKDLAKDFPELEGYQLDNAIATLAVRRFLERWRKEYKTSLRHWLVTELGHNGTENIHLHGIVWTNKDITKVTKHWKYGWVWKGREEKGKIINYVNERTINYITKYVNKTDQDHSLYQSIVLTSAGIGRRYTQQGDHKRNAYNGENTREYYRTSSGHKLSLPIYYRNKIYTEEQREQLWLHRIAKKIRWVCGEKIDISKSEDSYYKILKWHQRRNKELGYGDDQATWEEKKYQEQRRNMQITKRIERANNNNPPDPPLQVGSKKDDTNKKDDTKIIYINNNKYLLTEQGLMAC